MSRHHLFRYESKGQPLLSRAAFARRLARNFGASSLLIGLSLLVGIAGYHGLEGMEWIDAFANAAMIHRNRERQARRIWEWIDAFANAAMILSGMGPLAPLQTWGGKLFAGLYALYSGLVLIVAASILFAPVLHRIMQSIHVETEDRP